MRPALVSLVPMLAAAVLVMVGGERVARRETETRTPADRSRLLDLDAAFRAELARLDELYATHLEHLAKASASGKPDELRVQAEGLQGVRLLRVFRKDGKEIKDLRIQPDLNGPRLPEVELSNGRRPLDPNQALIMDAVFLEYPDYWDEKWLPTYHPDLMAYRRLPEPGVMVVILVSRSQFHERTASYLSHWLETPLTPMREAGERLLIEGPDGSTLVSLGPERHGPAASIIPIRSLFGNWQIRSWDGLEVARTHDSATLILASTLAVILLASGVVLMHQQKNALKLAAERVSFVNRVSHEFGAPLTNLSLNLDLAAEVLTSRPSEAQRRLGLVAEEIGRLSRLVANVLTFSRRERDSLELKPAACIPDQILQQVVESFRPALERRGIRIESELAAAQAVRLDPDALSQITGNLLSNVEKYAAGGNWLGLASRIEDGFLILEVSDRGEGIPASHRQRVFTPFERVLQATNEGASGTGLGLSIGRDLARRMGGELELLDSDVGARFQLRIPAPPAADPISEPEAS